MFSLEANQEDSGQSGWVSFLVDLPDKKVGEPGRENNWSKAFFYVLDRNNPSVPTLPEEPGLDDVLGGSAQDLEDLLRPDPVCACLIPRTSAALTVGGSDRKILYIGVDVAVADLIVENNSDEAMKKVKIYSLDPEQGMVLIREIEEIAVGGSASATVMYFPRDQPGLEERQVFIEYTDEDGKTVGFGSNLLYLETQCPIALVALDPDPNPATSEVMQGGTFCRYYRVVDRSQSGQPVPNAAVKVRFLLGDGLVEREFKTDLEGDVITESLTGESSKGLCVPWDLWSAFPELPMDGALPIKATANVDELWLMAEMPNACRAEPMSFDVALKGFEFEEAFRAGASSSIEGSLVVADGSLRDGSEIEMALSGRRQGEQQAFDRLSMKRSESSTKTAKLGFMAGEFGVKTPFASCNVKVLSAAEDLPLTVTMGDGYEFSLGAIGLGEADRIKTAGLYLDAVLDAGRPSLATSAVMRGLNAAVENFSANKASETWGVSFAPSLNFTLVGVNAKAGIDLAEMSLDMSAAAGSSLYSSIETEDFLKEPRRVRTCEFTGELNAKLGLELGLESVLSAGGDPVKVKETLIKEKDVLVGISGGWSRGMKLALTLDKTKALLPERLEVTFKGKKEYGYKHLGGELVPLGEGEDFNITYSVSDLKDLLPVVRSMAEYGALLDAQRKAGMGLDPTLAVTIGPQRIYERLIEVIYLLKKNAEYSVVKEDGTSKERTFGLGLKFLGVGLEGEDILKTDHLVSFVTEKGVFKAGLKYKLEDYTVEGFQDPARGELETILDQIETSVADRTRSAFEAVQRDDEQMRITTQNSSDLRLRNQADYASVLGPLSFNFEARPGPFSPYRYSPGDIIGAADKPHYGIGGFHEFYPVGQTLTQSATLTIDYHEDEIQGLDEGSLAIYRWNNDLRDWEPVVGTLDASNNKVTAEIDRLGAYTIGPAMPAGKVTWENRLVQEVGEGLQVSLTSAPLLKNNGAPVPDGTIFHVISALPFAYTGAGLLAFGEVLSPDVLPELTGKQVRVQDARLQVVIEYPGNVSPGARIVIFSDAGTALGDEVVSLAP